MGFRPICEKVLFGFGLHWNELHLNEINLKVQNILFIKGLLRGCFLDLKKLIKSQTNIIVLIGFILGANKRKMISGSGDF